MTRRLALTVALAAVTGAVTACSGSSGGAHNNAGGNPPSNSVTASAATDGVQQITVKAGDDFRFDPSTITVHPGKVTITLVNDGKGAPHNLQLPSLPTGDWVPLTSAGDSASITFDTPAPGTYQFICSIHVRQGQTGSLVVLPS